MGDERFGEGKRASRWTERGRAVNEGKEKQWEKEDEMEAKNKVWGMRNWAKAAKKKESVEEKDER